MRYVLLVYTDEALLPGLMTPETIGGFISLGRDLAEEGRLRLTVGLDSVETATTVRVRDGRVLITDGPFAETREQLGGLSIAFFDSEDDALAHAARIPTAVAGCVEVRPVLDIVS
ncbi:MAG: YciI family protein [Chloroflexi bacterium]|nr:YciI family protein [Chloroflexota bacterium]